MPSLSNPRHERFAQELAKGQSASAAYEAAGFKASTANASRLNGNDSVRTRVAELTERAAEKAVLTKAWVLDRLRTNVERAMQHEAVKDGEGEPTGEYKYEGHVANRALELLGKELGMFKDAVDLTVTREISSEPLSDDDWARQHVTAH